MEASTSTLNSPALRQAKINADRARARRQSRTAAAVAASLGLSALSPRFESAMPPPATIETQPMQENLPPPTHPKDALEQSKQQARLSEYAAAVQVQNQKPQNQQAAKEMKEMRQALIRRGIEYLLNLILGCIGVATAGTGFIIAAIPYVVTLIDLNLQLIWGSYITKGKSKFFPPLTWKPVPMPLPDFWLHAFVIFIDVGFITLALVAALMTILIIYAVPIALGGASAVAYSYFTDPIFQQMVNEVFLF